MLGDGSRSVEYWVRGFEETGLAGLQEGERPGRPPRLSPQQRGEVDAVLRKAPREVGMAGNRWDGKTLAAWIELQYGAAWGYASVRECFDHWDSVYANRVLWWRRRTRNARRRIKKTPGADGRSAGGSVGKRRGAFSATWFALPDVDSTGDQGPDFAPSSHSPQRRLLGCRSASRGQVLLSSRDRQVQRCYLPGLPASPLPGQHHGIAPARRDHRPCPVSPCPATSQLAGGTCEPIRPRLSTALQPRSQPERTGLEAYPAAMLTQPILPATQRGHRLRRGAIRTVGKWQRYFAAIMRNYLRRCV